MLDALNGPDILISVLRRDSSQMRLGDVTVETRGWGDAGKRPRSKECRQILAAERERKCIPQRSLQKEHGPDDTLILFL